jgi:hypothetical protein
VTCDYNCHEWDALDKGIFACECGAPNCRGSALGFKYMTFTQQCELIANATTPVVLAVCCPALANNG